MIATISLDASDLLKIARLVHDTPHEKNSEYKVSYYSNGFMLLIKVTDDLSFGYCVKDLEAWFSDEHSQAFTMYVPSDISTQIESAIVGMKTRW